MTRAAARLVQIQNYSMSEYSIVQLIIVLVSLWMLSIVQYHKYEHYIINHIIRLLIIIIIIINIIVIIIIIIIIILSSIIIIIISIICNTISGQAFRQVRQRWAVAPR